jgi:hypothetical protein
MYLNNQNIKPEDPDTIVWKYLICQIFDLLMSQKLFMSRSDKFEDQYEGTFSEPTLKKSENID